MRIPNTFLRTWYKYIVSFVTRYFNELSAVRSEVGEYSQSSEDENYPDGAPRTLSKKQRHKLSLLEGSLSSTDMIPVVSTLATKSGFDLESHVTHSNNPYDISDDAFRKMVIAHRKKKEATHNDVSMKNGF